MPDQDTKKSKTILVVEDHQLNMKLWNDILEAQGYLLLKTAFGAEAVEIARNRQPDLILLDIQLPDISGFEVVRRLKANEVTRSIPVIALTAFARKEHEQQALESGCDGYISKPVNVVEFLRNVATFIAQ
jgi:two-component system cell cycle response regulator DivK